MGSVLLSEWAKTAGINSRTAYRWFKQGKLPYPATRTSERIVMIEVPDTVPDHKQNETTVIYARVSSNEQKEDLQRQVDRLKEWAIKNGYTIDKVITEIASGMNPHRKKLAQILKDDSIKNIIVEHKDRLARINADLIITASSKNIVITDKTEPINNDIVDIMDFMTSVCARRHGQRSAKNRAQKLTEEVMKNG